MNELPKNMLDKALQQPDVNSKLLNDLDAEIPYKLITEHAYDGSTISRHHEDPADWRGVDMDEKLVRSSQMGLYGADLIPPMSRNQKGLIDYVKTGGTVIPFDGRGISIEKPICYVGIDPGLNGGVVAMTQVKLVGKWIMPLADKEVDIAGLYGLFKDLMANYNLVVILEDVHSIFGVSASANWTFGFVCGAIEAVVVSHKLKLIKIQPKKWQAEIWSNSDKVYKPKKPEQKNPSIDTKGTSLKAAVRLFPGLDLRKSARATNFHDGIIDGLLLSEYGRRKNL